MQLSKLGKILLIGVAGLGVAALLLMLGVKLALDRAPAYKSEIKSWVHRETGYNVDFAHVWPAFRWYGPELYFDQLELRSKDDTRVLARAAGGRVAVDVWQLIRSGKLLAGRVELDAPAIVVTRVGPAQFAVASELQLNGPQGTAAATTLDDLPAGKLAIRHATLTLRDWNAELPELTLRDVNIDARRTEDLAISARAQLPPILGGSLYFSGHAHGLGDLKTLTWDALARAVGVSFPGWRQLLPEYLDGLDAGTGAFKFAANGRGLVLARADLDFGASNVVTQRGAGPIARFEEVSGVVSAIHAGERWSLAGKRVRVLRSGLRDPDSEFDVTWRASADGLLDLRARANFFRADTLLPLGGLLPQKELRDRLRDIAPSGEWRDAVLGLERSSVNDPWTLQVKASFHDVGYAPLGRAPGLRGLSGTIAGNELGGHIDIESHTAVFEWPRQFLQPVDLEELKTTLYWKRTAQALLIATPQWQIKTRDAAAHGKFAWETPTDGSSPVLTLASTIENGNAVNVRNYLPREQLAPSAVAWLERAFAVGHMSRSDVAIRGPIKHFPFRDGSGFFFARCALEGVTLDYADGWPHVENMSGVAEFRNEGMSVRILTGRIGNMVFDKGDARFADFKTGELQIHASGASEAADVISFLRSTPLDASSEHAFSGVEAKGPLEADIDLLLPFKDFVHRRVLVHTHLNGVSLNRVGSTLQATDMSGDVDIDGGQVAHAEVRGHVLGGPFQMQARSGRGRPLTRTQLDFRGTFSGDALRSAMALPASVSISGQSDWRATLRMAPEPSRERSLRVSASLAALDFKLPAPLDKPAGTSLPTVVDVQWPAAGGAQGSIAMGTLLGGTFALEPGPSGLRLAQLALTFGDGAIGSGDGQIINVGGTIGRFDLGGWLALADPSKSDKPVTDYLRSAKFNIARLDYLGLVFSDLTVDLNVAEGRWRIGIGGPNVVGTIVIPGTADMADPWRVQFDKLRFADRVDPPAAADSAGPAAVSAASASSPHAIPTINFHALDLIWDDRDFGDVVATIEKVDDGIVLTELTASAPSFTLSAHGEWRGKDAGQGHLEGLFASTDVQATLKQLGYADLMDARSGKLDFDLRWAGAPTADSLSEAVGHVGFAMDKGQIVGIKPGAGRVLGLASLAALPRRLSLDFSDLTDKGLAFDTVRGDFALRDGSAVTDNVLLKGPAADIGLIGRVGLKNKDYDQTAVVTGNVSSTLPFAGFVGGPVVGAVVLVFAEVFKQPLRGLARGYYRITGGWDNPIVERVKSAAAPTAAAEVPK